VPHTAVNEAHEKFLYRLDHVNAHYFDYQQGTFTDRGLIYLKYGEPDEVVAEVVPLNRESVADALEKVENRYHPVSFSTHGIRGTHRGPSKDIIIDPRRIGVVGEGGNVAYPYELWIYNDSGDPILARDKVMETEIGLRFIFIDREGYGRYKLESSSSMTDK
jgi:GWxTD domain-containing protein